MAKFKENATVKHIRFGLGRIILDKDKSVVIRFDHGLEECLPEDLEKIAGLDERIAFLKFDPAINVVSRILGSCILSINDSWGVFSRSRIALLPHQLWVCKRVIESWPTRWLVADDVGLGKTIEAGLILTPLLSSGKVRRLLILAPASLVEQWQVRLREMFDIRLTPYSPAVDTDASDFWNTQNLVVASAHTLRCDIHGRWERLLEAHPWDLLIVDEAHHMNVDRERGKTLAFQLAEQLQEQGRLLSMVLFTGTPHRGKDYGFLSLLKLLRPGEFDPNEPLESQVHKLRDVMIRNNKQRVTDMNGKPIFTPVISRQETYKYSPEEEIFYHKLTEFIVTGKAYAAGLDSPQQRTAILVLITMQKLASSSIAAVRKALMKRLLRLQESSKKKAAVSFDISRLQALQDEDDPANLDEISRIEERLIENLEKIIHLNPNEIPALEELIEAADAVSRETKIKRILEVVDNSFADRSVLFFTEYKATQALLMGALQGRYGDHCVTFINGDGFIEGVKDSRGQFHTHKEQRKQAAKRFNRGEVRFLVSTEAAGEGIDLQENCYTLIHVDLPWNPMRLHQRVGRISRYGQTKPVDVVTVRNPDTVESRIWECLDEKLDRITLAFQGAMDDPEDMRQLVIGMASPRMFNEVFAGADQNLKGQQLKEWFDEKTATFGGEEAIQIVRNLFGNVAKFDFGNVADEIPKVDLRDLIPFFKSISAMLGKRPHQTDNFRLSFTTPSQWLDDFRIQDHYKLLFAREPDPLAGEDVAGVGLCIVDRALQAAVDIPDSFAVLDGFDNTIAVFTINDRITGMEGAVRKVVVGMRKNKNADWELLRDWELLLLLNPLADKPRSNAFRAGCKCDVDPAQLLNEAGNELEAFFPNLDLPFKLPTVERLAMLVSGSFVPEKNQLGDVRRET